ncbi:MAG: hypothetical protein NT133_09065 [Alphaproteobacteria bacterium]|nr:hypothetical protein [Alphaproteobacteria bacterium]
MEGEADTSADTPAPDVELTGDAVSAERRMPVLDVTSGFSYPTLSAAISASTANDVLWLDIGSYVENFPDITHNLTIQVDPAVAQRGLATLSNPQPMPLNGWAVLNVPADQNVNLSVAGLNIFGANNDALGYANGAGI